MPGFQVAVNPSEVIMPGYRPRPRAARRPGVSGLSGAPLPAGAQSIAAMASAGAATTGMLIGTLAAIPIAGPIAAGIAALGVAIANVFGGCGQTCVAATQIVNQVEPILKQNLETYLSAPVRYVSMQKAAENNFLTAWSAVVQNCSVPQLGTAGVNCVKDRDRGGRWDWWAGYYDPIANDPHVVPDPVAGAVLSSLGVNPAFTIFGMPLGDLVIPAGLILAGALL